ncbi:hypothetical protein C8R46DRAFT_1050302 [Mycena filopes]|nr:hypothetical protein C8R46DRAFT_1050302 [Mycena filopes]
MAVYYQYFDEYGHELAPASDFDCDYDSRDNYDDYDTSTPYIDYYPASHDPYPSADDNYPQDDGYLPGDDNYHQAMVTAGEYDTPLVSVDADDRCMEISYGEAGYWEEYHRRRYEIIYGEDSVPVAESELEELVAPTASADAGPDPRDAPPWTLAELQAAYDSGDMVEEDLEECAQMLEQWRAAEAAGYVWDPQTGEWLHQSDDQDNLSLHDGYSFCPPTNFASDDAVHHVGELAQLLPTKSTSGGTLSLPTSPSTTPSTPVKSATLTAKNQSQKSPRKRTARRKAFPPRSLPQPRRPGRSTRFRAQRVVRSSHRPAGITMGPASGATPPSVRDGRRCSPHTVPIVPAAVHLPRVPAPPDIPATVNASFVASGWSPDVVVIPRAAKPPDIRHVPAYPSATGDTKENLSPSARRRRNAMRRIAKKGKG